ncbi:hypothetical protein OK016_29250 [Vibrio chagasii]|nr:hypothetical protein [Vibrio chagasii]
MGWLQSSIALEVCLTDEQKQWRDREALNGFGKSPITSNDNLQPS